MLSISGFSSEKSDVCVCVYTTGLHREAEGRDSWAGDRGVGLGLHPAHGDYSKHDAQRPGREVRQTEHRGPDYVHQWHQPGGVTSLHLPEYYQGTAGPRSSGLKYNNVNSF